MGKDMMKCKRKKICFDMKYWKSSCKAFNKVYQNAEKAVLLIGIRKVIIFYGSSASS